MNASTLRAGGQSGGEEGAELLSWLADQPLATRRMRAVLTVTLSESYAAGVLALGEIKYAIDEKTIYLPYRSTVDEALEVIGQGSERRTRLGQNLLAITRWLDEVIVGGWELWVRGPFAADLNDRDPEDLDLVLFGQTKATHEWPLQVLAASPVPLHPGRLRLVVIPPMHNDQQGFERDREAIRSSRRCREPHGEQRETGWITLNGNGGHK